MAKPITFCKNHPDKQAHGNSLCRACYQKGLRKSNPAYAESQKKLCKEWRAKNLDYARKRVKDYYEEHKESILRRMAEKWSSLSIEEKRKKHLRDKYNLTLKGYTKLFEEQKGVCAICKKPSVERLNVDHNHRTGKVRGLLCNKCNRFLGFLETLPKETIQESFKYLNERN